MINALCLGKLGRLWPVTTAGPCRAGANGLVICHRALDHRCGVRQELRCWAVACKARVCKCLGHCLTTLLLRTHDSTSAPRGGQAITSPPCSFGSNRLSRSSSAGFSVLGRGETPHACGGEAGDGTFFRLAFWVMSMIFLLKVHPWQCGSSMPPKKKPAASVIVPSSTKSTPSKDGSASPKLRRVTTEFREMVADGRRSALECLLSGNRSCRDDVLLGKSAPSKSEPNGKRGQSAR